MVTREDLESFLIRMDVDYEEVAEGIYLVRSRREGLPMVVNHSPPLVVLRLKVMDLDPEQAGREDLFRTLLQLNANDLIHGAYGLEENELVLTETLQLENLTFPELQASVESIMMAAASHMDRIRALSGAPVGGTTR
jgi:hypothetical protein